MAGCQAGLSMFHMMNAQSKNIETQDNSKKMDDQQPEINGNSPKIIDSLYEARMIIHVTGPASKGKEKVRFQETQEEKDEKVCDEVDFRLDVRALEWMPAVQRVEVVYGLALVTSLFLFATTTIYMAKRN
ncbi:hypothetical protein TMatcc_006560 [Talaromyces marneffei ATCC 18224]|nr:hypothetical protein EYB25_002489 [Talaromyces marneffei]